MKRASGVRRWYKFGRNFARCYITRESHIELITAGATYLVQSKRMSKSLDCGVRGREWQSLASQYANACDSIPVGG